jgi:HK97 family phage prohead protease
MEGMTLTTAAELLRIGIGGIVPVTWDVVEKDDGGPGTLTGWASVYNVVDQQDDVVIPGAFRKTIADWIAAKAKRVIPLTADHNNTVGGVIGSVIKMEDHPFGLKITFGFASTQDAQDARIKAKEKHLNGLSIFGPIFAKEFRMIDGREIRVLKEVGLDAIGLTAFPALTDALVTAVKGGTAPPAELPDAWIADMRAALTINAPSVRKSAVDALVVAHYGNAVTGGSAGRPPTGGPDDPPADQGRGGDLENAAASYALSIIGASGPADVPPGGEPRDSLAELLRADAVTTKTDLDRLLAEFGE